MHTPAIPRVFVSHSRADEAVVARLVDLLFAGVRGLDITEIRASSLGGLGLAPGADVDRDLVAEVVGAGVVVALITPNSMRSQYVIWELAHRDIAKKPIVALRARGMPEPDNRSPLGKNWPPEIGRESLLHAVSEVARTLGLEVTPPAILGHYVDAVLDMPIRPPLDPVAYAVLAYAVDSRGRFALIEDHYHGTIQGAGRRLEPGEQPHVVVKQAVEEELGLRDAGLSFHPMRYALERYGRTTLVPAPYQVQFEDHEQRSAQAHYDLVYVLLVDRAPSQLTTHASKEGKQNPRWYTLAEVEHADDTATLRPHQDMLPTMRRLLDELRAQGAVRDDG